jgi:alpha-tubulin suppressor-like RCC1 family protein
VWLYNGRKREKVLFPSSVTEFLQIDGGISHHVFLTNYGVFGYGSNLLNALSTVVANAEPTLLPIPEGVKIVRVACGGYHTLFLSG